MIEAIEVQVISKLLTSEDDYTVDTLLSYDLSYFSGYQKEFEYIRNHRQKYGSVPGVFDFQAQFPDFVVVSVPESIEYLQDRLREYKKRLILLETFNKIKDLGDGDTEDAWKYLSIQCDKVSSLESNEPLDLVKDADKRARQVQEYAQQQRIPTGFDEIDKVMYGGLSTVEELLVLIARSNAGKSWCCTKMAESAQKHGFPVAYYSPEMQAAYLATRFDTWRNHFENSQLFRGNYNEAYYKYLKELSQEDTSAYIIEDKDFENGVSPRSLATFVKKHGIKLLIVDGISYMQDDGKAIQTQEKYKNIAKDLFQLSKKYGCAVVLVMQANREVKNKDDKGESIPDMYNAEGSDHPCRIATQAFGIRQIFDKHVLDIKLLKTRMANNQNPVFSYAWDINTGNMSYIPGDGTESGVTVAPITLPNISAPVIQAPTQFSSSSSDISLIADDDENVEF